LQPGDVIATGTPAGVGMPRGEFLKAGDEVKIEIEGLGTLTNRMVADSA
jgi:2-keto-4-pentenoate hydratase/2-oxohepta-3-ene-1,7-dioic acid hydratase in catechol pathway